MVVKLVFEHVDFFLVFRSNLQAVKCLCRRHPRLAKRFLYFIRDKKDKRRKLEVVAMPSVVPSLLFLFLGPSNNFIFLS